jgi:hypothetical protein
MREVVLDSERSQIAMSQGNWDKHVLRCTLQAS